MDRFASSPLGRPSGRASANLRTWLQRSQAGQAIVLIVFMMIVLIAGVGLAVDAGVGYYYNTATERAAAAAALAGVIFMPNQFGGSQANGPDTSVPAGAGNDATDRAITEARRNGFDVGDVTHGVRVTPAPVPGSSNKLQVTVSRTAPTFFMSMFGISSFTVQRVAIATYVPPIQIGQPGNQIGSTVSQLGSTGFYFMRTEGYSTDRGQGDAFTPNNSPAGGCSACPSSDVHALSNVTGIEIIDPTLPSRGGYNFRISVPTGQTARVQVYNAAFAPDDNPGPPSTPPNFCENAAPASALHVCSPGGNYYLHETDCCGFNYGTASSTSAMQYTLMTAPNVFVRASDRKLTQMIVDPLDARNFSASPPTYVDFATGSTITQAFNADGSPANGQAYHSWMDIAGHVIDARDQGSIRYRAGFGPLAGPIGAGQYRLRVDTLEYDGSLPPPNGGTSNSGAHKGFAVRVMDGTGLNPCAGCTISAVRDMAIFTPVTLTTPGAFQVPLFQLPPDYAGKTVSIYLYDMGDMNGSGAIYVGLIDPRTNALLDLTGSGRTASIYDIGTSLSNSGTAASSLLSSPTIVEQLVTNGSSKIADNKWYQYDVPIPNNYNPGPNPANWWWSLQYRTTGSVTAADTVTVTIGLKGNPAHLLQS
jgi:hypothetical protein